MAKNTQVERASHQQMVVIPAIVVQTAVWDVQRKHVQNSAIITEESTHRETNFRRLMVVTIVSVKLMGMYPVQKQPAIQVCY
jgi:hypothetical protein